MAPWLDLFPQRWRRLRLRNLVDHVQNGTWGEESESDDQGVLCVRAADFDRTRHRVNESKLPRRVVSPADLRKHKLNPGDLVLEKSGGGDLQPVGAAVLYDLGAPAVPTNFAARVRPAKDVDSRFLSYVLACTYSLGINQRSIKQTTGIQNLDAQSYFSEPWAVPRSSRQRAIADFLDRETTRIDALIAKKRELVTRLNERFDRLVLAGVRGNLTRAGVARKDSGLEWLGPIPKSWPVASVGTNYEVILGKMLNPAAAAAEERFPYLRNTNVQWDEVSVDDLGEMAFTRAERYRYRLKSGDLLVCEGGEVGRAAVWQDDGKEIYFQKAIHRVRPRGKGNTRFLMYCLRAAAKRDVFRVEGNQATILHLTAEKLRVHRFPFPSPNEQTEVVRVLDAIKDEMGQLQGKLRAQLELIREHRQALITAAVTGHLKVPRAAA